MHFGRHFLMSERSTAVAKFKTDLLPSKELASKFFNIQQWTEMPRGGHLAAMEQPELLVDDIRKFVSGIMVQSQSGGFLEKFLDNEQSPSECICSC
jgi:hypothetical protein